MNKLKEKREQNKRQQLDRTIKFTIQGELPNLNQAIDQAKIPSKGRNGRQVTMITKTGKRVPMYGLAYNGMKAKAEKKVIADARIQLRNIVINQNCAVTIVFYCKDRRLDPSNIDHAKKYIFDALQTVGVLPNDGWKNLSGGFLELFAVDPENPRIEVYFMEGETLKLPHFKNLVEWTI